MRTAWRKAKEFPVSAVSSFLSAPIVYRPSSFPISISTRTTERLNVIVAHMESGIGVDWLMKVLAFCVFGFEPIDLNLSGYPQFG